MDPTLKRRCKPTSSSHIATDDSDPTAVSRHFYMSSKRNSSHKVTPPSLSDQKPTKNQPLASIDAHLQAKGMTLSADFDACRVSLVRAKHHQKLKTFEPKVEKGSRTNEVYSVKVKKPSSQELVEVKRVDQVRATQNNRKEACGKVKSSKELKDLVDSVEKKKVKEVQRSEKKKKEAHAKGKEPKELKDMTEEPGPLDIKRMTVSLEGVSLGGGRRRSYGGSQVELTDFLAKNGARVVSVDMPPFMQIHAVDCARKTCDSLENFTAKALALTLKKEFDGVYGPAWHCIVGTSFGSFVTHSVGGFLYFSVDQKLYVLLFKTTVQKAN